MLLITPFLGVSAKAASATWQTLPFPGLFASLWPTFSVTTSLKAGSNCAALFLPWCCVRALHSLRHLVLVSEDLEQRVVHQHLVHLLELLQRVLVVLTGALRQDVHLEVRVGDLLLVRLLVRGGVLLTLALERLLHRESQKCGRSAGHHNMKFER